MSDRKYRQRGYQDDDRDRTAQGPQRKAPREGAPRGVTNREHRTPNMPGFHDVIRCARCGHRVPAAIGPDTTCASCAAPLHTCAQCGSFDTGRRFECVQPIPARVSPKDARNDCAWFEPQVTVERQTHSERSVSSGRPDAKRAFDDLFK